MTDTERPEGPRIRPISEADAARWRELFTAYGVFYETAFTEHSLDGVWAWILDPEHPVNVIVAVDDADQPFGFALYRAEPDTFTAGSTVVLEDLYVDPDSRTTGAGTALIEAVAERARVLGAGKVRWITAADNLRAQKIYDRIARRATWVSYEMDVD
jgi:GNAT superfamily N-acetyltransferase